MTISATTQGLRMGVATSSSRPTVPFDGQVISETDTDLLKLYNGTAWVSAGGMTLLSTTTLTGASVTVSGIDQTYNALQIYILGAYASSTGYLRCYFNNDSTSGNYSSTWTRYRGGATTTSDDTFTFSGWPVYNAANKTNVSISLPSYAGAQAKSWFSFGNGITDSNVFGGWYGSGGWSTTTAISSLVFINSGASWTAGTVLIYGVK